MEKIANIINDGSRYQSQSLNMLCFYFDTAIIDTPYEGFTNIQCGRAVADIKLDMLGDDSGVNISDRNSYWSEITGLYWAWLNIEKTDYVGLCSYRRFFNYNFHAISPVSIVKSNSCQALVEKASLDFDPNILNHYDIITPIPYIYPRSICDTWAKNFNIKDLVVLSQVIGHVSPCYYDAYLKYIGGNKILGHNMFVMKWDGFQDFCKWVFSILFNVEKKVDPTHYPRDRRRVFGYMHEILLGVYITKHNLKTASSQIIWINDELNNTYFNKTTYQVMANILFALRKI